VRTFGLALAKKVRARQEPRPTNLAGYVRVSGVWIGARKLEGELDVGGRRIFMTHRGIHSSRCGTSRVLDGYSI
jgi:hypothetical protein